MYNIVGYPTHPVCVVWFCASGVLFWFFLVCKKERKLSTRFSQWTILGWTVPIFLFDFIILLSPHSSVLYAPMAGVL